MWMIIMPAAPLVRFGPLDPVCRLGLATRGTGRLEPSDILHALDCGINFLNWHGGADGLSQAIAGLGARRSQVVVCVQFEARTATRAERELDAILRELHTDYVDVLTFYYVEEPAEWEQIAGPEGALAYCRRAQQQGKVRLLGLTSHQRPLAAHIAQSDLIDMLMIRYNTAHRGAETDIFPVTSRRDMPVVTYTSLRWGALLESTPDDPAGYVVSRAGAWYRWVLENPAVTVALMAPQNRAELDEDLTVLQPWQPLTDDEYRSIAEHGQRVRRHAGQFP
jgi:predicted aldo/keto reductase-like oxidoreductase